MIHTTLLGALMALAPHVLYFRQTSQSLHWGRTPSRTSSWPG